MSTRSVTPLLKIPWRLFIGLRLACEHFTQWFLPDLATFLAWSLYFSHSLYSIRCPSFEWLRSTCTSLKAWCCFMHLWLCSCVLSSESYVLFVLSAIFPSKLRAVLHWVKCFCPDLDSPPLSTCPFFCTHWFIHLFISLNENACLALSYHDICRRMVRFKWQTWVHGQSHTRQEKQICNF